MPEVDGRALRRGAVVAVAICLPVAVVASVVVDEDDPSAWAVPLYLAVLLGFVAAGWVAGRTAAVGPLASAVLAALAGYAVVQGIGVVVSLARGDGLELPSIVLAALLAQGCGLTGAVLAGRWRR